jgi:antitoxin component of RelBE/YafQ-DinJ toxin-antitoxin module
MYEMGFTSSTALFFAKIFHKNELPFDKIKQKFQFPIKIIKKNYKINFFQKNEVRYKKKNKKGYNKKISIPNNGTKN